MSKRVTLTLSAELYEQIQRWAAVTGQDLKETLIDALTIALAPVFDAPRPSNPITTLSDEELLDRCKVEMDPYKAQRLSRLLQKERAGLLKDAERRELDTLISIKNRLWMTRSQALDEAERRGLRAATVV